MSTALTPYRSAAIVPKEPADPRPTHGIIRLPKPPAEHKCKVPGSWAAIWSWLTNKPLIQGSLHRCGICGTVRQLTDHWCYKNGKNDVHGMSHWQIVDLDAWLGAGGGE